MNESFDRLLNLAQKTNSRLIIYDRNTGKHLAILGIDDFENLHNLNSVVVPVKPIQVHDHDADKDHELIQKLNQEIAEWRNKAQKQEAENSAHIMAQEVSEENLEKAEKVIDSQIVQPQKEQIIETSETAEVESSIPKSSPLPSSSWHKFGDVMASYQPAPRMPEVRYEPNETPEMEKTEPLDDEPIFLEEPVE